MEAQISPNPAHNGAAEKKRKKGAVETKLAAARAAKRTKAELIKSAEEGFAMYGPRRGEKMTYWRAAHIFACLCTAVIASATTSTSSSS